MTVPEEQDSGLAERAAKGLLVFAKAPVPGRVKTRLVPALDAGAAARLQEHLMQRTLETAYRCAADGIELWCDPDTTHPAFAASAARWPITLYAQPAGDLGQRMAWAFEQALRRYRSVVLVGSDCAVLSAAYLDEAFARLEGHAAVFGPAEDGGYVLAALRASSTTLFSEIDWGGARVMRQTRMRLCALGWKWHELPPLWDVDRPDDLPRLEALGLGPG
jgi:hypothetical protein